MVCSGVSSFGFRAFMTMKHLVGGCASSVSAIVWTALLYRLVLRLFICLFAQHERKHR